MWRICNKLFGWQYIALSDCHSITINRVITLPDGSLMGKVISQMFFIDKQGNLSGGYFPQYWRPLTWKDGIQPVSKEK
jgi:hypothetical protein